MSIVKVKRIPRAEAPCIPFTKRRIERGSMGIKRITSSTPCLILFMRIEGSLLKSVSGASKFISNSAAVMLRSPGQARGGRQQGG
eukprot:525-Pelagomonas_calceolata.AAC.1